MEYRFQKYVRSRRLEGHLKMGGYNARGELISANSQYFTRDGLPWIGVMGEYHYCRDDRENWRDELLKMKAGGVSLVSTYVFWNQWHLSNSKSFINQYFLKCHVVPISRESLFYKGSRHFLHIIFGYFA